VIRRATARSPMKVKDVILSTERNTFAATLSLGFGIGKSQDNSSALVRPFRILIDEGKPVGKISHLFLMSDSSYVLGAVCLTPARRLLFFPGLVSRTPQWYMKGQSDLLKMKSGCYVDHLTLEAGLESLHVTMLDLDSKKSALLEIFKTKKTANDLTYFFGLSVRSERMLEPCPQEIRFQLSSTTQDCERRANIIEETARDSKSEVLKLPFTATESDDCFLHFDFLIDLQNRNELRDMVPAPTAAPTCPPALKGAVSTPQSFKAQSFPVKLPMLNGTMWVISSLRNGQLTEKAVFTFPL